LKKRWCLGKITSEFIWHMEDVLDLYPQPYDPLHPQICVDERPCQLIGDVQTPLPMTPGQPPRQDYECRRNGACCLFVAFEPHTGQRFIEVRDRRTRVDYAEFMKQLAQRHYPHAHSLRVVQDNLNTHSAASFYEALAPQQAFELAQKFEFHYPPKKGRWLNMAEIELSALSKPCLDRRIADIQTLTKEVNAWQRRRNRQCVTVHWRFTKEAARQKFQRHYPVT
jgi:hypothetical protein